MLVPHRVPKNSHAPCGAASCPGWRSIPYAEVGMPMPVYVVQTVGGKEKHVSDLISQRLDNVIDECFVPCSEVAKRYGGAWHRIERTIFPGYVFVRTDDPDALEQGLHGIAALTKVLGYEGRRTPLTEDETSWLNTVAGRDDHVARMSEGVIEGGTIKVLSGPLMGYEGSIQKIDRHKRLAYVEIKMLGRTTVVKLGLEIVSKS